MLVATITPSPSKDVFLASLTGLFKVILTEFLHEIFALEIIPESDRRMKGTLCSHRTNYTCLKAYHTYMFLVK